MKRILLAFRKMFSLIFRNVKKAKINWESVEKRGDRTFQIGWRLAVLALLLGVVVFIIKGFRDDGFAIKAFDVPKHLEDAGYSGTVLARKLVDELSALEIFVSSVKEEALQAIHNDVDKPDLDVEVMGIGLTLNAVTFHLRELLGRENRSIGGELTDVDQRLTLTLRMTGSASRSFSKKYVEGQRERALEYVVLEAAKAILATLDPYRLAIYHYKKDEKEAALEVIGKILKERPEDAAWAYVAWGNLLTKEGKYKEGIDKFQRAIAIDPKLELARNNWAWEEFRLKNFEKALQLFEENARLSPEKGGNWNSIAFCLRAMERFDEADRAYARAVEVEPDVLWWYGNWADMNVQRGDTSSVEEIFGRLKSNVSLRGADYYLFMASYFNFKGEQDSAMHQLERVVELEPKNFSALRQLSGIYLRADTNFSQIKEMALRTIDLAKEQNETEEKVILQNAYNYIAMAEYKMEEYDSAYYHVQLAIKQDTSIAYPYTTLAEIHGLVDNHEGFYAAAEIALQKGFHLENFLDEEPYNRYAQQARFQDLLRKYGREGQVALNTEEN